MGDVMGIVDDAWLAGLYEGEGSCSFVDRRLQLQIKMTDQDVLERALRIAGVGRLYGPYKRDPELGPRKDFWVWIVYVAEDVQAVLARIRPWLCVRRTEQIDTALAQWVEHRRSMPNDATRFLEKIDRVGGHLLWRGAVTQNGYGHVWVDGPRADPTRKPEPARSRIDLAHRVAWKLAGRELPPRANLRNLCGELLCVKPDHWELAGARCPEGHDIVGDNVLIHKDGARVHRRCRICQNSNARKSKEKARGKELSL